jgi:uncharacterized protein (DUF362 family)/Pyruvate/2-oxoacid:ferredoxin oxidoreductase delta subunit
MPVSVSVLRCKSYQHQRIEASVRKAIDLLGGIQAFVAPGESVLIKPNLLANKTKDKAVNTDPGVVRAVARIVIGAGGKPFIGDSPGIGSARKNADRCGIGHVAEELGIPIVEFDESVDVGKTKEGQFPLEVAAAALKAEKIINLPKLKTHGQMLMTLGVKNMFGCVIGKRKIQWHFKAGVNRAAFARMLVEIHRTLSPQLTLIDGVVGMEGNGPGSGAPRQFGLIAASADAVALDAVVMHLMGLEPLRLPTLSEADKMGVGVTSMSEISLLGDPVEKLRVDRLRLPESADLEWGIPDFLIGPVKNSLTAFPEPDQKICNLCRVCLEACPQEAISVERNRLNLNTRNCIRCFCCQELCPQGAMKTRQGWLLRLVKSKQGS